MAVGMCAPGLSERSLSDDAPGEGMGSAGGCM